MDKKKSANEGALDVIGTDYRSAYKPLKKIIFNNFIGGIAWTLGVATGSTIIIALLSYFLGQINLVPFVGNFVLKVVEFVQQNNPNL